jgi:AraC-like DNA-binding protein/predicted transcriptional regulator YdeE
MRYFSIIKEALEYIDSHLDESLNYEMIAEHFNFSAFYFHRMFSMIVGKTITCYIRDRRLTQACVQLATTDESITNIGFNCGYNSTQSFSRAFKSSYGLSPSEYRRQGFTPIVVAVDEMIMKFTNRLRGGIYVNPKIIKIGNLIIAGICGDGNKTGDVWNNFEKANKEKPLTNKISNNAYEIRLYDGDNCTVHVGFAVTNDKIEPPFTAFKLPASKYASFDVYVENGYDSENTAMDEWIKNNEEGYSERLLSDRHYCVEYYDERFNGSETGSIVEIWVPIENK